MEKLVNPFESQIELIKLSFFTALVKIYSAVVSYGRTLLFFRVAVTQILNDIERYFINKSQYSISFLCFYIFTIDKIIIHHLIFLCFSINIFQALIYNLDKHFCAPKLISYYSKWDYLKIFFFQQLSTNMVLATKKIESRHKLTKDCEVENKY